MAGHRHGPPARRADHIEPATAAAREARNDALLAFAAWEQACVLLDLAHPAHALRRSRLFTPTPTPTPATPPPHSCVAGYTPPKSRWPPQTGEQDDCRAALDLAAREISRPQAVVLPYLALDTAHLARWRGNCLIQFGDTATISDLTTALAGLDGTFTRPEAGLRCDLAAALHATGERHEARQHLKRATELAQLTGSARQRRRITTLAQRIGTVA